MTAIMRPAKTCPRCRGRYEADALFCPRDGAPLDEPAPATEEMPPPDRYLGTVVAGDIDIRSVAGMGAMGRVYRAHQRGIERDVAVKILHRELSSNTQLVSRFNREAKIASKLQHPHVVEVFLAGQLEDGSLYTVMEFLDGVSLASALREAGGVFAIERALAITLQICDAVGEAHARGIVHRDLKPENVMLVHRAEVAEWVKVLDFGIAKLTLGEQSMETAAGLIFGTARYISPEGAQGRPVGPPGDVYAITTMLYEMLAGRTPFEAEPLGLLIKHIHETPPDLRAVNAAGAAVPAPLARAIVEQLCKEPEKRAPNGRALAAVLAAAAREANISLSDIGAVARMSHLPDPGSSKRVALAPTVDDFGLVPTPRASISEQGARSASVRPSGPIELPRPSEPSVAGVAGPTPSRWPAAATLFIVFLLGSAVTALLLWRLMIQPAEERRAYYERVRLALAEGHYVTPPGENVRDLVDAGMKRWPGDGTLRQLKSAAAKEMVTSAFAARESGDLVGARNLASLALDLEASDNSARYMRAQCEEELADAQNGTSTKVGLPRVIFEAPHMVKPSVPVEVKARIIFGAMNPKSTPLKDVKLTVNPTGRPTGGPVVTFLSQEPEAIRATFTSPSTGGTYDVAFEADVGGTTVRAMRDLDVLP